MTPEEFRRYGHAVVDWLAGYMEQIESYPVLAQIPPGDVRAKLPPHPPEHGESFDQIITDLDEVILPGVTHWQSPSFFAYFPANASGPAILGDLVSAGLGVQGMLWATSPACTELETHVLDWLVDLLGLPAAFRGGGVIQDSASSAMLCALLVARERATDWATNASGVDRRLIVYTSTQAHSAVEKAVRIAGLGDAQLRLIDVDETFALRPEALARQIVEDRAGGATPCLVVATVGSTSSTAIDPLRAIGEICRREGVSLHVDAAYAGSAAICPELRWIHEGLELADSYCFNPHKWLLVNFDCTAFYVADPAALVRTLTILPEFLRNTATSSGAVIDYRDWQVPLGRRFRALKLWFVLRSFGAEGLRRHIRRHVALAQKFASWVGEDDQFEIAAPHPLGLVCFRHVGGDEVNQAIIDRLNASGRLYLSHT
ncbi:MAG: aminotransferase class V-fold PLP-dependent enzyme, partial [Egibacteraceae bacterium]